MSAVYIAVSSRYRPSPLVLIVKIVVAKSHLDDYLVCVDKGRRLLLVL